MTMQARHKKEGAVNVYAIDMTVYVHAQTKLAATTYIRVALKDWAAHGNAIGASIVRDVKESDVRFYGGILYPEDVEQ
jgi:hypothetical protein